jgi:hypothetical protein
MRRVAQYLLRGALLDYRPKVENNNTVRDCPREREIMGDEEPCNPLVATQLFNELKDLCSH